MAPFKVHTVKFYDPEPLAIHAMAISISSALETAAKVFLDQTQYPNIDWVRMFNAKYNKKFLSTESNCEIEIGGKSVDNRVFLGSEEPLHVYIRSTNPSKVKKAESMVKQLISAAIEKNDRVFWDEVKFKTDDAIVKNELCLLALSRSDNSIEIWDVQYSPVFLKFIPPLPDVQIECVGWYEDRLFAAGLHGFLYEIDYHKLDIKEKLAVTSGPAWCMSICKPNKQIAIGTEEGYINIFNILKDSIEFHRILDKQQGRILCIAWHPKGTYLATGSIDTIRVWTPTQGNPVARMNTGRVKSDQETIVWAIEVTDDLTVISGDSNGRTAFWNGETGTLLMSIQSHDADVLALAYSRVGSCPKVYSAGVSPFCQQFENIRLQDSSKWVKNVSTRVGQHDTRCVVACPVEFKFCSGGVDSYLTVTEYHRLRLNNKDFMKGIHNGFTFCSRIPSLPKDGVMELAGDTGLFAFKYRSSIELWRLGESDDPEVKLERNLHLSEAPTRILRLETPGEERLLCSTINKSGTLIAYSTKKRLRVFSLVWNDDNSQAPCTIKKLKIVDSSAKPPHCMSFYQKDGSDFLLCGYETPRVESFSVGKSDVCSSWVLQGDALDTPDQLNLTSSIQHIKVTGTTAVVSDFDNQVVALDLKKVSVLSKMPRVGNACVASLTISPNEKNCVVAYSDQKITQMDIETARFTSFYSKFNESPSTVWKRRKCSFADMNYIKDDLLMLYDFGNLVLIDEEKEVLEPAEKLRRYPKNYDRLGLRSGSEQEKTIIHPFDNTDLVGALPLNSNSIVCVELSQDQIDLKLPQSIKVKSFN